MKILYIIRHAKSSWSSDAVNDFDRPLNQRGKRDAPLMGEVLDKREVSFDLILSSSARRAKKTSKKIAKKLNYAKEDIIFRDILYLADPEKMITEIKKVDASVQSLAIVGHNPGMTEMINLLSNIDIDNLPTCGVVAISLDIKSWLELSVTTQSEMLFFEYPKKHINL